MAILANQERKRRHGCSAKVWHSCRLYTNHDFCAARLEDRIRAQIGGSIVMTDQGGRYYLVEHTCYVEAEKILEVVAAMEKRIEKVEEFHAPLAMLKRKEG